MVILAKYLVFENTDSGFEQDWQITTVALDSALGVQFYLRVYVEHVFLPAHSLLLVSIN